MEILTGPVSIAAIFQDHNNWKRYLAWRGDETDPWTRQAVSRMLACRTPALGCHVLVCPHCKLARLVPHSCKSPFCSSCGTARTDAWCEELLSDILDVSYRHLIFTLPQELRHLIRVNKKVLLGALYRAASRALLSLTAGIPKPLPGINRTRMAHKRHPFLPGFLIICHSFGSDLKFNPHLHVLTTCGGLSLDRSHWIDAPIHSLVRGLDLAREWKKNVLAEIRGAEEQGLLCHPPFRGDPQNPTRVDALLVCVAQKHWWIHVGPSLQQVDHAVRYCCRYTRRPVIGEMRIVRYDGTHVHFLYADYYDGGTKKVMCRSALFFIHRLIQHIPPKHFIQVRHYGLFANRIKAQVLPIARRLLRVRKRRRPRPLRWHDRRKRQSHRDPLACPQCHQPMLLYVTLFGCPETIATIAGVGPRERLPPECFVPLSRIMRLSRAA